MIQAQIAIDEWDQNFTSRKDIETWLTTTVGPQAQEADQIDESRPWGVRYQFAMYIYYFARESDAVLFRLRWPEICR